ncbi:MAG: MBL fold metallo-hydrolase [Cyanobacteria bacterium J06627_15]
MTTLTCIPFAVGHRDEGVCLGVEIGPYRVLLDCGLRDVAPLLIDEPWDAVICSHAHTDHARGLGALRQHWPTVPIYSSEPTAALLAPQAAPLAQGLPWRTPFSLTAAQDAATEDSDSASGQLSVELWPAGHLPGAAATLLTYQTGTGVYRLLHLGDCFLSAMRLVEGLPLTALRGLEPDVLIVDGSYGNARYPHRRQQENDLTARLRHALDHQLRSRIVFPVPSLGLGQELLMLLRSHYHTAGYPVTIWVDPIVAVGCDAYLQMPMALARSVQNFAQHQSIFWDDRVFPHVKRLPDEASRAPLGLNPDAPAIFIVHPATLPATYCQNDTGDWTVFLSETGNLATWQSEQPGSVHGDWLDALKNATALGTVQLETYLLTEHCDGTSTTQLIHNLRPRHVVLQHGDPTGLTALADLETLQTRYKLHIPTAAQQLSLELDTQFWRSSQPITPTSTPTYEGEVTIQLTQPADAVLTLPADIVTDPRWRTFAETGLISAQWQGANLVIRGVDPGELLSPLPKDAQVPSCANCRALKGQICRQPTSPLFNRKVALDGSCAEFISKATDREDSI